MKKILLALFIVLLSAPAFAAIPNTAIWEVESGGSDTNGGGFISGASGTDFSQQTSAQISVTDAVAIGTTTIVSATAGFATTAVGNIIYLQGGTGTLTAGWYQVVSRTNATTIVVDRNVATGTGITLHLGGAFATVQTGINNLIADQALYVKAATYTITTSLNVPNAAGGGTFNTQIIGYSTVRGDQGRPTISQTGAANIVTDTSGGNSVAWLNFIFDGTNTALICLNDTGSFNKYINTTWKRCTTGGLNFAIGAEAKVILSEVTGITGGSFAVSAGGANGIFYSYIHDNSIPGCQVGNGGSAGLIGNVIANNTGDGCDLNYDTETIGNLFYGNSGDGAKFINNPPSLSDIIMNNIFAKNGGFGINSVAVSGVNTGVAGVLNNGFWNNTSGATNNFNLAGSTNVLITGSGTTNDPFVADSTKNWALNNTAGAGALLRNAGFPGVLTGLSTSTGYQDIGPFRHQDPAGGVSGGSFPFGG